VTTIFAVLSFAATDAESAGYQLRQQGAAGLGTALAGSSAGAHGLSDAYWNPAVYGLRDKAGAELSLTYIHPVSEAEDTTGTTALGTSIPGAGKEDDATPGTFVPALYGVLPAGERLRLGLSINAPFGLQTDYRDDWVGRYHARESEVKTISLAPVAAFRVNDRLTLAGGPIAQYYDARLTNAVDFGTIARAAGNMLAVPGGNDGGVELEADDWAFGFTLGAIFEPVAGSRIGVGYRSEIDHDLDGNADFDLDPTGVGAALQAATGAFADTGARADVSTPRIVSLGLSQDVTSRLTLMAEAQWIGWSAFDTLRVRFDNAAQADDVTDESWDDAWFGAVGARYRVSDAWTLRAGVAYDESPVPDSTRTPRIPDADRTWVAIGAGYNPASWLRLDFGYTHLFMPEESIDLSVNQPGNTFRGNLEGRTDTSVDVFAIAGTIRF
jgi:long-chain fatty acid transport protein